jgi:hypothetical protein
MLPNKLEREGYTPDFHRTEQLGVYCWLPLKRRWGMLAGNHNPRCTWDRTQGFDDTSSLKIDATDGGTHAWWCTHVDLPPTMPIEGKSRFTAMVKTEGVKGYARMVYYAHGEKPLVSKPVTGTVDWTQVTIDVPENHFKGGELSALYFEVKGPGTAWCDNVLRESEATRRPALETSPLSARNRDMYVSFFRIPNREYRTVLSLWDTDRSAWTRKANVHIMPKGVRGRLSVEPARNETRDDLAVLNVTMPSVTNEAEFAAVRVSLHKAARSALFQVTGIGTSDAPATASFGLGLCGAIRSPFVLCDPVGSEGATRVWRSADFVAELNHHEDFNGPARIVFAHPDEGWAMFGHFPAEAPGRTYYQAGAAYSCFAGASKWCLVGGITFPPGTA